tara:strand:- start:3457 stop:4134 length:678 start_codon:yes stop_codon:yes gene_type:complete
MFRLDLDEIPKLDKHTPIFSYNKFNIFSFFDRDYLSQNNKSTKIKVIEYLRSNGLQIDCNCKIELITMPRIFGYTFNPVSFYFISEGNNHRYSIAQVNNTFGEMKLYLLTDFSNFEYELRTRKYFYVSPFSRLDTYFHFKFKIPNKNLDIRIDEYEDNKKILLSSIFGREKSFHNSLLIKFIFIYPFLTLKVILLIHYHALLLKLKGLGHHPKKDNQHMQRNLIR